MVADSRKAVMQAAAADNVSPAFRQIRKLASETKATFSKSRSTAGELYSFWSIRLWNSMLQGRRIVGLNDFVRALSRLESKSSLYQVAVMTPDRTALLFLDASGDRAVGAIVAPHGMETTRTAIRNFEFANQDAPEFLAAVR